MKKTIVILVSAMLLAGCGGGNAKSGLVDEKFMLGSAPWGETWETVSETAGLSGTVEERGRGQIAELDNTEFLGVEGTTILEFDVTGISDDETPVLINAYFRYNDEDEERLIAEGEKIYGERQDFFLDENGVENPLNPPAWYSEETVEGSLTDAEKEKYSEILGDIEQTRADAIMRGPLVVISVEEDSDMVRFSGNDAAIVKELKELTE